VFSGGGPPPNQARYEGSDPTAWHERYTASGTASARGLGQDVNYEVPASWSQSYSATNGATNGQLALTGTAADGESMGYIFGLVDPRGLTIDVLRVIVPYKNGRNTGSTTFSFTLAGALDFLAADTGSTATRATRDGRYLLTLDRPDPDTWRFKVEPNPAGPGARPELTTGELDLHLDRDTAPFQRISVALDASSGYGSLRARVTLNRAPLLSTYTVTSSPSPAPTRR
jgi:hypothetical protein